MADDQREPSKGETMKPTNGKERVVSKPTDRKKKVSKRPRMHVQVRTKNIVPFVRCSHACQQPNVRMRKYLTDKGYII